MKNQSNEYCVPFTFTNRHALHPGIWDPFSPFWWVYLSHRLGVTTVGTKDVQIIPHRCKRWCISNNLSPISLLKIAGLSDLSQKKSRHAVKTSNVSYHTKPYISQEIYKFNNPPTTLSNTINTYSLSIKQKHANPTISLNINK